MRSIIAAINEEDWALREMIEPGLVVRESSGPRARALDDHGADRSLASDLDRTLRGSGFGAIAWIGSSSRARTFEPNVTRRETA